ncbi:hypothetical protein [Gloeothece verrucosa]|uniref:Uncharacterized protein n=1 Tax=Gloeothece verrucosa (strain PCC 7822) TaxID=497965 RepID=E0UN46_GLOV7|nr:hypothetical protein [Gloeothece verrucosa]ADN18376.1 hypothetical protein Cyan7822_6624 [Gloeothece verrucosa PCC 7822]
MTTTDAILKQLFIEAAGQKQLLPFTQKLATMLALKIKTEMPHLSDEQCGIEAQKTLLNLLKEIESELI